jgi:Tol biopolymer transport system component
MLGVGLIVGAALLPATGGADSVATTIRVSVATDGSDSGGDWADISADGRHIAFVSNYACLDFDPMNPNQHICLHDRDSGDTELIDVNNGGEIASNYSIRPAVSGDGRFVVFWSLGSNLVTGDTNNQPDIFVRDRQTGTTSRVNVDSDEQESFGNVGTVQPGISADGRYVVFKSSGDLAPGSGSWSIFIRDLELGTTEVVTETDGGIDFENLGVSADGRFVVFSSWSSLVPSDTGFGKDVYVRDRMMGTTELVSVEQTGEEVIQGGTWPTVSDDGRFVAFSSSAPFVSDDTNGSIDVFVRDLQTKSTERVSLGGSGQQLQNAGGDFAADLSADGQHVAFVTFWPGVPEDTNNTTDVS